jgi:hypothetical protein
VLLAQIVDVGANRLEDPQAEESQQADEPEVERVGRFASGREHGFELQVRQPKGGRLWRHGRATHVVRRGVLQDAVDDTGPIEAGDDRQASRHR